MKRSAVLMLAALALAATPVRATPGPTTGTIRIGALSPSPARALYNASASNNGLVGYAFTLPSGSDGKTYTLTRTSGPTNTEDLDAYFYTSLDSETGSCDASADLKDSGGTETGTICPATGQVGRYAIIVIKAGANASFSFTVA